MNRPASIVTFERLYLGSFAIWLIGLVVFWSQFQHNLAVTAAHQPANLGHIIGGVANVMVLLVGLVTLLLWYLVARRASLTAAWIVIITEAFGALSTFYGLIRVASGGGGFAASGYVNLAASILAIAAAVFLLRPDAKAWLGAARRDPGVTVL